MKSFKLYLSLLLLMAFGLVGCNDNFDTPPVVVPVATIKANTTIADFKKNYWQDATSYVDTVKVASSGEDIIVHGYVVSSDATGNIYKSLVIQDETGALAMSINGNSLYNTYRIGQEVVINLTDMYAGKYAGLFQLGFPQYADKYQEWQTTFMPLEFFQAHAQLNGLPNLAKVDTITTTIGAFPTLPAQICAMQSQLIRLDNVHWETPGVAYSESDASTSRNLVDGSGNSIIVRNSNYATFKSDLLPEGEGSVVGILSYYNTSWQLLLRSTTDVIGFKPASTEGTKADPYSVVRARELQGQGSGWVKGYIVGAVAPEVTEVKTNADIQWQANATLANTIVIGANKDTLDLAQFVIVALPQGSALRDAANLKDNGTKVFEKEISLTGVLKNYLGQPGVTTTGAASDYVLEGSSSGTGTGTKDSPFTVAQLQNGTATGTAWVTGYIVGWVDGMTLSTGANFTVPATSQSNILIAASAGVTDASQCIPIQLPAGEVRSALNLQTNTGNLGKQVSLYGSIEKYFGTTGVKTVTDYVLAGGGGGGDTPSDPVATLSESFTSGIPSTWKSVKVSGDKNWYGTSFTETGTTVTTFYAAMTGYKGTTAPFEAWLITPPLNVKTAANTILTFRTQMALYESTTSSFEVYVMSSADPTTATLTKLNPALGQPSTGTSPYGDWVNSGNLNISGHGDVVYVGFKYKATANPSATWCVTDVTFGK